MDGRGETMAGRCLSTREMDAAIRPEGWNHWLPEREKTAYFAEYKSSGPGANDDGTGRNGLHQLTADGG